MLENGKIILKMDLEKYVMEVQTIMKVNEKKIKIIMK